MSKHYLPEAGDIVWVDLTPTKGHEQSGRRPAMVLSHKIVHQKTGLALICPITTKTKYVSFELPFTGNKISGSLLILHVRSIDLQNRPVTFIETASRQHLRQTRQAIAALLGAD